VRVVLLTGGGVNDLTGGTLYHRRIGERAARLGVDFEMRPLDRRRVRTAIAADADLIVVDSIVAARVRPERLGVPAIASVHQRPGGLTGPWPLRRRRAASDLRSYRVAGRVVVPSAWLANVLVRGGVARERIRVVPPGRDVGARGPGARERTPASGTSFVCVANVSGHKRPLELLEAFASLRDVDVSLTLIGSARDARLALRVRERLRRPDLAGRAAWLGPLAPAEVAEVLTGCDVFVLPAVDEAYGMAVAEGLALGLPAIVARSGNLPALVRDGEDGVVVPADDREALARAMRRLARDPDHRRRLSTAAEAGASRFPTWDETTRAFVAVLREAQAAASDAALPTALR
jgi:glycosyltransferase involved in cell wall biosynthesis